MEKEKMFNKLNRSAMRYKVFSGVCIVVLFIGWVLEYKYLTMLGAIGTSTMTYMFNVMYGYFINEQEYTYDLVEELSSRNDIGD